MQSGSAPRTSPPAPPAAIWPTATLVPMRSKPSSAICLCLPPHSQVHPTFHVSRIKPVLSSTLCPIAKPLLPPRTTKGAGSRGTWTPVGWEEDVRTLSTERAAVVTIEEGGVGVLTQQVVLCSFLLLLSPQVTAVDRWAWYTPAARSAVCGCAIRAAL